ncbi:MAG: structural protein P5 [Alistipes sp.]|nr:structural protein P5 [Alistipes sp.]
MSSRLSRGLRNLNPGNIRRSSVRYKGEKSHSTDSAFKQFESLEAGYRAMFVLLHTYFVRGYGNTIEQFISRYAPPVENDTEAYIARVCRTSGVGRSEALDTLSAEQMIPVVCAMSEVENGVVADIDAVKGGWRMFVEDFGA